MALSLLPMTELEAVNIMLETIDEPPVNTLSGTVPVEVTIAVSTLSDVSREVQSKGWDFNTESEYPLAPDINGCITPPTNVMKIDASDGTPLVMRSGKLYDKSKHTNIFEDSIKCDIVWLLDFGDLPQAARSYITIRAARAFQRRILGSDTIDKLSSEDEGKALLLMEYAEADVADYNVLNNSSVKRVTDRTYNP